MKQKQTKGRIKEKLTPEKGPIVSMSIIKPCKIGIKAPPTIAITKPAAPRVVSSGVTCITFCSLQLYAIPVCGFPLAGLLKRRGCATALI